jgi:GAF domain-containing protein
MPGGTGAEVRSPGLPYFAWDRALDYPDVMTMKPGSKRDRYDRVRAQLEALFAKCQDPTARMATIAALVHAKTPGVSWTGFYLLRGDRLQVGPYQGPLACMDLEPHTGVCWAGIDRNEPVIVPDVRAFPSHIACDPRARSEIVIPLPDGQGRTVGVLDIDSERPAHFDDADRDGLVPIVALVHA